MDNTDKPDENEISLTGEEEQAQPAEKEFPRKKPGLSFMARKRRHLLIILGGRAPAH